jgi:hypothetical protein
MKEVLPWLPHWALRAGTRDFCPALAGALVSPVQNIIVPHRKPFFHIVWACSRAGSPVSVSLVVLSNRFFPDPNRTFVRS